MAFLLDIGVSHSISELSEAIMSVAQTTANFKPELKLLKDTLEIITPKVQEIVKQNQTLDRTEQESRIFTEQIQTAENLVNKCLKIKWNPVMRLNHSVKLREANNQLLRFFQLEVQADQSRDIKLLLVEMNVMKQKMKEMRQMKSIGSLTMSSREDMGWQVPRCPRGIVAFREALAKLKAKVLSDIDDDGIGSSMEGDERFADCSVMVVSAAGGWGKTTLVKMLCNDHEIRAKFGKNIFFVTVSESPILAIIINKLFSPYPGQKVMYQSNEDAKNELERFLHDKVTPPMLLVLDDVWDESFIENFTFGITGYKIVVTSREHFEKYDNFEFDPLSDQEAKTLFHRSAFTKRKRTPSPTIDENLVKKVVECCRKHPLTLSVVGSSLNGRNETIWRDMVNKLSHGHSVVGLNKDILKCLETSFFALDEELKQCYMDFGLFPKNHRIPASALLNMWVHLYNHNNDGNDTLATIIRLSNRNLVNRMTNGLRKDSGTTANYCEQQTVTQHDLLRELAIHLSSKGHEAQRARLIINARGENLPVSIKKLQEPIQAHIMSISTGELFSSRWCNMNVPNVEVLQLNLKSKTYILPHFLKGMQKLKILNITNDGLYSTEIENFNILGFLSHLTRIRLERVAVSSLSTSILELVNLQKLSFIMCKLGDAFEDPGNNSKFLPGLVEIEVDYCQDLVLFPGIFCRSIHLKKLSITNCNEMCGLSEEFGNLTSLEMLNLHSCTKLEKLPESITRLEKMSIIDISDCLNLSKFPQQIGKLYGLRTIYMKGCTGIHELPPSVKELSHTQVVCNEEISYKWRDFPNVKINVVKEDCLRII